MIVASVLLILVAVLFLALGLAGGSSSLLIASIVASLLAAVTLVMGARQAAARRATTGSPQPETPVAAPSGPGGRRRDSYDPGFAPNAHDSAPAETTFAGESSTSARVAEGPSPASGAASPPPPPPPPPAAASPSAADSAEAPAAAPSGPRAATDDHAVPTDQAGADQGLSAAEARAAGVRDAAAATAPGSAPDETDYRRAATTIGAARSTIPDDEQVWARTSAADAAPPDEFDEPDADDPDDEPLPQAVRPTDAVLVARLDSEVLVVDGRPRYHLADCPHLVGRLTEPLPAAEAVELGFSPCGLCRPVDRLVAATIRR